MIKKCPCCGKRVWPTAMIPALLRNESNGMFCRSCGVQLTDSLSQITWLVMLLPAVYAVLEWFLAEVIGFKEPGWLLWTVVLTLGSAFVLLIMYWMIPFRPPEQFLKR